MFGEESGVRDGIPFVDILVGYLALNEFLHLIALQYSWFCIP